MAEVPSPRFVARSVLTDVPRLRPLEPSPVRPRPVAGAVPSNPC